MYRPAWGGGREGIAMSKLAAATAKGLLAGAIGTAAMTMSSTLEMKLRGRQPSSAPADAVAKVLGLEPQGEEEKKRFSNMVHWGYGTSWGALRGLLAALGLGPVAGTAVHLGAVWGTELVMLPALDVAPPAKEWGAKEVAIDGWHHLVYAVATGVAYSILDQ